jgi:ArsR family metal-binding transcriptional regulator
MLITGYRDLALKIPECHPGSSSWSAHFRFDAEGLGRLFPYINAVSENTKYFENPHCIQFLFKGKRCALYEDKAIAAPFDDRNEMAAFLNELMDFLNRIYNTKESITPSHKKFKHISVMDVLKLLPRTNCRECGYPTCMAFAADLAKGEVPLSKCYASGRLTDGNVQSLTTLLGL